MSGSGLRISKGAYKLVETVLTAAITIVIWEIFWLLGYIKGYRPTLIQNIGIAIVSTILAVAIMMLAVRGRKKPFMV